MKRYQTCICFVVLYLLLCPIVLTIASQNTNGPKSNHEMVFWETVRDSNDIEMYRAYLNSYPNGHFTALVKIKIRALSKMASSLEKRLEASSAARVKLRSKPRILHDRDLNNLLQKYNFSVPKGNPGGKFENAFVDNRDGTITDEATGLIWQSDYSPSRLDRLGANKYIEEMNRERFGGHTDWRLPTVEELASLMEAKPIPPQYLHLDRIFQVPHRDAPDAFWSADKGDPSSGCYRGDWVVNYWYGYIIESDWSQNECYSNTDGQQSQNYVRAVSSN